MPAWLWLVLGAWLRVPRGDPRLGPEVPAHRALRGGSGRTGDPRAWTTGSAGRLPVVLVWEFCCDVMLVGTADESCCMAHAGLSQEDSDRGCLHEALLLMPQGEQSKQPEGCQMRVNSSNPHIDATGTPLLEQPELQAFRAWPGASCTAGGG